MAILSCTLAKGDAIRQTKGDFYDAFRQLEVDLPSPNVYRTASGAPGHAYWQQRADYQIEVSLDEDEKSITGSETISYTNNSPDTLRYIWLQLDQNRFKPDSGQNLTSTTYQRDGKDSLGYGTLQHHYYLKERGLGYHIKSVTDADGTELRHTIVDTMMRINLPTPLKAGENHTFKVDWEFNIAENGKAWGRNGFEHFDENDTYIFFLAQWFPRLVAYTDYAGWQHKQFLGSGEFTLEFGDYEVAITVPSDHVVSSTGVLQNPENILTSVQQERLKEASSSDQPVFIITPEEALENESEGVDDTKTWRFSATNVRDFAWASSRKFIWDAMIHHQDDAEVPKVLAMSFYPNEAMPIWHTYSTKAVVHTMDVYSRFSFNYPYPTAQSVNTWKSGGMEYPMITFNGYRPEPFEQEEEESDAEIVESESPDESTPSQEEDTPEYIAKGIRADQDYTYSRTTKVGLVGVIIHEIGHIYFPMTVNSDERQWTWMDEGINSFLQYTAQYEWEDDFWSSDKPQLDMISSYMTSSNQVPIMTQSDSITQFGNNAYRKPAAALTILRETIMGRELFDFAFREYSQRWKFKRPTPSDFFRTMEDASGVDLDWFWRGWFYSTDHVDMAITDVREYKVSTLNPETELEKQRAEHEAAYPEPLTQSRNKAERLTMRVDREPELADFYTESDPFVISNQNRNDYTSALEGLEDWEKATLEKALEEDDFIYFVDFQNIGGLPMPLPLRLIFTDGSDEFLMIPAEIWRRNNKNVTKLLIRDQAISSIELDPRHEIADADYSNNSFPSTIRKSRIELYKYKRNRRDQMAEMLAKLKPAKTGEEEDDAKDLPLDTPDQQ
ncbi:M1 family metallopeptidase [Pelagicoccus albus]|uniref:M1 family metallopeptidase n=1 Tax=Pelagicoccus albus TaxID=415222 RepID=A0A7X1E9G7_9BACT|nr:M1 family metallopeptidase [Pelagicoccus albus]MBC2607835.1 M1 family metallopeptidase [Pelagicoccus albus]